MVLCNIQKPLILKTTFAASWTHFLPWTAPQHNGQPRIVSTRWLLITQQWPHYSCLWKETSLSRPWSACQSQAEHLIKTTIGKDEDAVYTSSDRMGHPSPQAGTSPHRRDDWGGWSLARRKHEDNSCAETESFPSHVFSVVGGNPTPLSVWTVPDNLDVESDKSGEQFWC